MHAHPTVTLTAFSQPLQVISAAWKQAIRQFRDSRKIARQERLISRLPPHLRHDIGELVRIKLEDEPDVSSASVHVDIA